MEALKMGRSKYVRDKYDIFHDILCACEEPVNTVRLGNVMSGTSSLDRIYSEKIGILIGLGMLDSKNEKSDGRRKSVVYETTSKGLDVVEKYQILTDGMNAILGKEPMYY